MNSNKTLRTTQPITHPQELPRREVAEEYRVIGRHAIPMRKGTKRPTVKWENYRFNANDFKREGNLALRTGYEHGLAVLAAIHRGREEGAAAGKSEIRPVLVK